MPTKHLKPTTATWTIDQIGSFEVNHQSLEQVEAALSIAKKMRRGDDGNVQDAARAIVMLFGASVFDDLWFDVVVDDEEDLDRQANAYMDGVAILQERFPLGRGPQLCRYRYAA